MPKYFNTAGPCRRDDHYMLPPEARITEIPPLIEQKAYFVVHAPRQTGKTTSLTQLARSLTAAGGYAAVLTSCKSGETARGDVDRGVRAMLHILDESARQQLPEPLRPLEAERSSSMPAPISRPCPSVCPARKPSTTDARSSSGGCELP